MSEYDKTEEKVRIGVFICHCGSNIGGLIDCKKLAELAGTFSDVAYSEDNLYTCSETGLTAIKDAIKEHNLNRVVVASCTPRTHEPLFRECVAEAGLNPYQFNFVNIRDQNTWVHQKEPEKAYDKAVDLVKMGTTKAAKLEPLDMVKVDVNPSALVIGGGVSGMSTALSLSNQGFKTYLIEKEPEIGGRVNKLYRLFPYNQDASILLNNIKNNVNNAENLTILTSAILKDVTGFVGNFTVDIEQNDKIINLEVGAIIVAVGTSLLQSFDFFKDDKNGLEGSLYITQQELEEKFITENFNSHEVVMIQCVGSRIKKRKYCSSVCCMTALKNALIIKEKNPNAHVTILFRDIYTPGTEYEEAYRKARINDIIFMKYTLDKLPGITGDNHIRVFNEYIGEDIMVPYDLLVLSTPLVANDDNKELAQKLKVPLEENGFFLEAHVKLRPMDFATDGVFLCGSAKWPVDITESISQGYAAASRASTILSNDSIEVEGATSFLPEYNKRLCTGCEVCISVCPYKAINKNEEDIIEITQVLCKGCGTCVSTCVNQALIMRNFTDEQILSEIYAFGGK